MSRINHTKNALLAFAAATGTKIYISDGGLLRPESQSGRSLQFSPPPGYRFRARGLKGIMVYSTALEKMMKGFHTCTRHEDCRKYWQQFGGDEAAVLALLNSPAPPQELIEEIFAAHNVPCWFFAEKNGMAYRSKP